MKRSKKWMGVTLSLSMLLLSSCTTPTTAVIKTGQTTCYSADVQGGAPISCAGTGQDGEYQIGVAWPTPRFTENVDNNDDGDCTDPGEHCDGTVTDNLTGLIWLKKDNCGISNWADALKYVVQLNTDGTMNGNDCGDTSNRGSHQTDWRLPNVRELHSRIHYGNSYQGGKYWSSTTLAYNPSSAWFVSFEGGIFTNNKAHTYLVWPVRGGRYGQ